jgi:hypothetical protein
VTVAAALPGDEQARPLAVRLSSCMDEITTSQLDLTSRERRWAAQVVYLFFIFIFI